MKMKKTLAAPQREVENTFPKLLTRNYNLWGDSLVAVRRKDHGIWNEYTWKECYDNVKSIFRGLLALGMAPGDRVAILGDSTPEWMWFELAVQAGRGAVVAINPAASAEKIGHIITISQPRFVVAQDQEQVDKIYEAYNEIPFERLIYCRQKGLRHYDDPKLLSLKELINEGLIELSRSAERGHPAHFEQTLALGNGSDPAVILYVQGKSDEPEEVVISHEFLIFSAESVLALNPVSVSDEYVSLMNPGWFFEQALGVGATLLAGQRMNFAESVETAQKDFREISPHTLVYPSHLWHRLAGTIKSNVAASSRVKRMIVKLIFPVGYEIADHSHKGSQTKLHKKTLYFLFNLIGFRPLRDKHGLDHVQVAYSAGEPLSLEDLQFFHACGVEIKQLFASSDRGIVTLQPEESIFDQQFM